MIEARLLQPPKADEPIEVASFIVTDVKEELFLINREQIEVIYPETVSETNFEHCRISLSINLFGILRMVKSLQP